MKRSPQYLKVWLGLGILCLTFASWSMIPGCSPGPNDGNESVAEKAASEASNKEVVAEAASEPASEPPAKDASETKEEQSTEETPEGPPEDTSTEQSPTEPKEYKIGVWKVTTLPQGTSSSQDRVLAEVRKNTFKHNGGRVYLTYQWETREAKDGGALGQFAGGRTSYATTFASMREDTRAIAVLDRVYNLYINGKQFVGDYYGSGRYRVPVLLKKGRNDIVLQVTGGREPKFRMWLTPDDLYPNTADRVVPTLQVGSLPEQCVGLPIVNLTDKPVYDLKAEVVENDYFEATSITYPGIPASSTQVAFKLKAKKDFAKAEEEVEFKLRLSAPSMAKAIVFTFKEKTVEAGKAHRRTRFSVMDNSCQFDGVLAPKDFDPNKKYGLILSLHGAGVNALGQARSYSQKDWAYVVAPTNRRPFGFDWETWGRLDGLEALAHAKAAYKIDPTKVYVAGHSMGGHGTWQFGVLFPGKFALVGPSAGWSSFYSYTGYRRPTSIFKRSQASSETNNYASNLDKRAVYIIHGDKDNNVPVREGRDMYKLLQTITKDAHYHEEPGVGHWWNKKETPGTDCVDWGPMMEMMQKRTLDPTELDFKFKTPSARVSPNHSYVSLLHAKSPLEDVTFESSKSGDKVTLKTTNVGAMILKGKALQDKGIKTITVDEKEYTVDGKDIKIGPQDGKRPGVHGPFVDALSSPFCYVFPDQNGEAFVNYANYMTGMWNFIGNGMVGCIMPLSKVTAEIRKNYNMIYVGIPSKDLKTQIPSFEWNENEVKVDQDTYQNAAMLVTFPENGRLSAALYGTKGFEYLLYSVSHYTSRFAVPDYFVWGVRGYFTAGFFDGMWKYDKKLRVPN